MSTELKFDDVVNPCRDTFLKKSKDYGTSWRVYRTVSVADQIYIKAWRIRTIQAKKTQKVGDDIRSEFQGILNYAIIGLIQLSLATEEVEMLRPESVQQLYNEEVTKAKLLLKDKNHDYDEAWRMMSQESYVDLILAKVLRIKQIAENEGRTIASEGIDSNFFDILNYAAFALIMIGEGKH